MLKRGLLLDRDGVINVDHGYVGHRDTFEFTPGVFAFLRAAQNMGFRLAILTNQSGVGRGYYSAEDFETLTQWMLGELSREGITIELVLKSFEHTESTVPAYKRQSFWRKPNPGMVLEAVQRLRLDPARSVFLGDKISDMQAAERGGIGTCLLMGEPKETPLQGITVVKDFNDVLKKLGNLLSCK